MSSPETDRLLPTGNCWCGCGAETNVGAFFARGHDKVAEAALLAAEYGGSVPRLLTRHGYGAHRSVVATAVSQGAWQECPSVGCGYAGASLSVRNHQRKAGH